MINSAAKKENREGCPAEHWHDMIEIPGLTGFHTPPKYRGQAQTLAYSQNEEYIFEYYHDYVVDRGFVTVYLATEGAFEPWNRVPDLGELLWSYEPTWTRGPA